MERPSSYLTENDLKTNFNEKSTVTEEGKAEIQTDDVKERICFSEVLVNVARDDVVSTALFENSNLSVMFGVVVVKETLCKN